MNYSASQIAKIVHGRLVGDGNFIVNTVFIDSRTHVCPGGAMFVALVGDIHNGHNYIAELFGQQVRCFLVNNDFEITPKFANCSFIVCYNTLEALQALAAYHRRQFRFPVVGITGSNGKTIVKEWLGQLLSDTYSIVRSPKSYNSQIGVPLSVLQMDAGFELGIFEAGISQPHEMEKLERIVAPQIGIFTNLGQPHQENFSTITQKADEKFKLFQHSQVLIYCADYEPVVKAVERNCRPNAILLFSWGHGEDVAVRCRRVEVGEGSTFVEVEYQNRVYRFHLPFVSDAAFQNAMHCLCVMLYLGIPSDEISARMARLTPVAMRLELKEGINSCTIINDSYNSDLGSLKIALDFMRQQNHASNRILILSDILQSGIPTDKLYAQVQQLIAENAIDKLIGIGPEISTHAHLFALSKEFYPDTDAFLKSFSRRQIAHSVILIKGCRPFAFERISAVLEQKTHRTVLEIDLNALRHNLNYFRGLLAPDVRIMVMVKAFAYGSGAYEVANLLQLESVDYLGVAFADEGVELREVGIDTPIMVMNPDFASYRLMVDYRLEPEIYSLTGLHEFLRTLEQGNVPGAYPIHIKIDSGMHRLGFTLEQLPQLIAALANNRRVRVLSMFSHLAVSDEPGQDQFTQQQFSTFETACQTLSKALGYMPLRHILNSAGIERFPGQQYDMVRLGIGLHGISATQCDKLLPVSSLKTRVIQVKTLSPGTTLGYGRKGRVEVESVIATIPIGYADGLNRRFGNGVGKVLINSKLAPFIGNICMDTCMVDATGIGVAEGDEVVIFGHGLPLTAVAQAIGTIPYEVLTSISRRVKRVYFQE